MNPDVTITLTLSIDLAREVLAMVDARGHTVQSQLSVEPDEASEIAAANENPPAVPFEPIPRHLQRIELRYLLHGNSEQMVHFIVSHAGRFFNDELASELKVDPPQLTSIHLGQLTRALRKVGVRAEGFRGSNWYTTRRLSGRTLITVRADVLEIFKEAIQNL
jgi:hypothetical protein